jgi:hypothetical protein
MPGPNDPIPETFAEEGYWLSPTFLQGPTGQAFDYAMWIQYDALADAASYAVRARFPDCCPDDAFPWLAQDRQIDRGPNEGVDSYASRLRQWLDLWAVAGGAPSVLRALTGFLVPGSYTIETVKDTTADGVYTIWDVSTGGSDPPTHYQESPGNWNWDATMNDGRTQPVKPGRAWVVIYAGPWAQDLTWNDPGTWGDGGTWDTTATPDQVAGIHAQVEKWKDDGSIVPWIIVAFDPLWFVPTLPAGDPHLPDGTWGEWCKVVTIGGVRQYAISRTQSASYWDGDGMFTDRR